jgi:hypothetical protein
MRIGKLAAIATLAAAALAARAEAAKPTPGGLRPAAELCAPYFEEMASKGKATRTSAGPTARLLPLHPSSERVRAGISADEPGMLVESAFFLPRPAPADQPGRLSELAGIYGLLRSISSLEGIQYFSVTHGSMRTLFVESYRIDGPETKRRLPDLPRPSAGSLPIAETLYAFQRDLSLGSNTYRYELEGSTVGALAEITNLTRMSYGILPLVAPGGLKMRLLVLPASDGIIFYAESDAASPGPFRSRLEESFANRAAALFAWFSSEAASFIRP